MQLQKLISRCVDAMRTAAYESYYDYHGACFRGCTASIDLPREDGRKAYVVIECDAHGRHSVVAEGGRIGEYPLLEARLTHELDCRDAELDAYCEAEDDEEEADMDARNGRYYEFY